MMGRPGALTASLLRVQDILALNAAAAESLKDPSRQLAEVVAAFRT